MLSAVGEGSSVGEGVVWVNHSQGNNNMQKAKQGSLDDCPAAHQRSVVLPTDFCVSARRKHPTISLGCVSTVSPKEPAVRRRLVEVWS